jgi:hypothetical protein
MQGKDSFFIKNEQKCSSRRRTGLLTLKHPEKNIVFCSFDDIQSLETYLKKLKLNYIVK